MYGRGRGTYLGLLLGSQIGKNATTSSNTAKSETSDNLTLLTNDETKQTISSPHGEYCMAKYGALLKL